MNLKRQVDIDPYIGTGLGTRREQYCAEMSNTIPISHVNTALQWIEDQTVLQLKKPFMLTGRLPSSLLQSLVLISKAKKVLEIGAYTGYSAVSMGATGASVTTIDSFEDEPESENIFCQGTKMSGLKIQLKRGKALDILPLLAAEAATGAEPFDFVFIDADKTQQVSFYNRDLPTFCKNSAVQDNGYAVAD
jgi:caffeoyl-CoA O-methyltransferase